MYDETDLAQAIADMTNRRIEDNKDGGVTFGRITSVSPLKIHIDMRGDYYSEKFFTIPYTMRQFINNSLPEVVIGTRLVLLNYGSGQEYLILDRM